MEAGADYQTLSLQKISQSKRANGFDRLYISLTMRATGMTLELPQHIQQRLAAVIDGLKDAVGSERSQLA